MGRPSWPGTGSSGGGRTRSLVMSADSGLLGIKACIPGALECQGEGSLSSPLLSSTGGLCPPAGSLGQPNCSRVGRGCGPAPQRRQERAPLLARADVVLAVAMLRRRASTVSMTADAGEGGLQTQRALSSTRSPSHCPQLPSCVPPSSAYRAVRAPPFIGESVAEPWFPGEL